MLAAFKRLLPVPTSLSSKDHYKLDINELNQTIKSVVHPFLFESMRSTDKHFFLARRMLGASVIVMSNPRNPTGQVIEGRDLERLVGLSREGVTLV